MRALAWILLGLVIGSFATLSAMNALRAGSAVPHGLMAMLGHHMDAARTDVTAAQCSGQARQSMEVMALLARDVKPVFLVGDAQDEQFARYADDLVAATRSAMAIPGADCAMLSEPLSKIGDACKACHRDYK